MITQFDMKIWSTSENNGENYDQNDNEEEYGKAGQVTGVLLMILHNLQMMHTFADGGIGKRHVALYVIQVFTLMLDQHCHVQEHLVQLV